MQSPQAILIFVFLFCLTEDKLVIKGEWTTRVFLFFWEHSFRFLRLHFTGATRSCECSISCHISKPGWNIHQEFPALQGVQEGGIHLWAQFSSLAQSCLTVWDPMNCSTPSLPVHYQLLEFTQTHVHQVGDAIQPSHPLSPPSSPAPKKASWGKWKSWLKAQHSENEDHGIWSHHFMGNRWGNSGNSGWLYFWGLQNHCRWWLQPWN